MQLLAPAPASAHLGTGGTGPAEPSGITLGPDGALWFSEQTSNRIGRMTPSGILTEYAVPTDGAGPSSITVGTDGAMWFAEEYAGKIGRITATGAFTEYAVPSDAYNN